jgi:subtilisin family serine protease
MTIVGVAPTLRYMALRLAVLCGTAWTACFLVASAAAAPSDTARDSWPKGVAVVSYDSPELLARAVANANGRVVRRVPALGVAEVAPRGSFASFVEALAREPGLRSVERLVPRTRTGEPGLALMQADGLALEWQYAATRADAVPAQVLRDAARMTIAVVDTGADVTAPDLAAKTVQGFNLLTRSGDIRDVVGHGTFVASLAAGSVSNGEGMAGFGGDANLLVVKVAGAGGTITDVDEAAAIVYAVDHGARVVNLSFGGVTTSATERAAVDYAVAHGALLVSAVGNESRSGNPVEYPAALLQPVGSEGRGGRGLTVAASTIAGTRASFSNTGTHVSLAAPGEAVLGAVSSLAPPARFARVALPGSRAGLYGLGSGTSFATPQVSGAAALVWAANPSLGPRDVALILKQTATGHGAWNPELGFGVIDVASAVARAAGTAQAVQLSAVRQGLRVRLSWGSGVAASFRLAVSTDGRPARTVLEGPRESTTFGVARGHVYVFTVAALDADGAPVAASAAVRVRIPR